MTLTMCSISLSACVVCLDSCIREVRKLRSYVSINAYTISIHSFLFFKAVLTASNRHQTTWFCPSAATQLRAGLRLPIGCTTIQQVPRNESCAVPRRSRGLFHPSQVRRTTNATKRHPGPRPSFVKLCRIFIWTTHVFSL